MPCPGDGNRGESLGARSWTNWAGTLTYHPLQSFRPDNLRQLVAIVAEADRQRLRVRAVGSSWSYTGVAVSDNVQVVVETDRLRRVLNGTRSGATDNVVSFALRPGAAADARHLVHVEAGIKIEELNCVLDARGLAMPTLGGEKGQSALGAISTGTHGADVALPPIADAVQAIHLVGPAGREWWIERSGERAITEPVRMEELRRAGRLCNDLILEYDDETFNAVLVSMGRMGIVYSVVLRVRDAFRLRETRDPRPWSELQRTLRAPGATPPVRAFNTRFVEIVVNPYRNDAGDNDCVLTRRVETTEPPTPRSSAPSPFSLVCGVKDLGPTIRPMLFAVDAAALAAFGFLLAVPIVGPALFAVATTGYITLRVALEALLVAAGTGADLGQALARVCTAAAAVGQSWIVRELVGVMVQQIRGPLPGGFAIDKSFKVMTSQSGCEQLGERPPVCMQQIDGMELAFDAGPGRTGYIDFVNATSDLVMDLLRRNRPVGVALSLRFTSRSEALLAMQQFGTTCSIEVIVLRGLPGNDEFMRRVQSLAYARGAIPHWGLIHQVSRQQVDGFYGDHLVRWRRVLQRVIERSNGRADTFSTTYSVQHDLEPLPSCTLPPSLVDLFRRVIEGLARLLAQRGMQGPRGGG